MSLLKQSEEPSDEEILSLWQKAHAMPIPFARMLLHPVQEAELPTADTVYSGKRAGEDLPPAPRDWIAELLRLWNEAYPRMDIYAAPGSLVMFDGRGGYDGEQKQARATLRMRGIYQIKSIRIGSSSSTVELVGVTGRFNTVLFAAPPVGADKELVSKIIPDSESPKDHL